MNPAAVLTFSPDGSGHGLYTEVIELGLIGPLSIERATTIEFSGATQQWEVRDPGGTLIHQNRSRADCLAWEHRHFTAEN
jgi:hypothetical protein